jgi:NAD(P)H-flavin reductase
MIANDPWQAYSARIVEITPEISDTSTYHLNIPELSLRPTPPFMPGQFNMLYLPGVGESAISVSGYHPHEKTWLHTVRAVGNFTRTLAKQGKNASLLVRGPFGNPWPLELCAEEPVVLVAGGLGLAPLRPAVEWLLEHRQPEPRVTLIYGTRSPDLLLFNREYDSWCARGLKLICTVDRAPPGWQGYVGVVTQFLARSLSQCTAIPLVFTCGPEVMMRYVARTTLEHNIPADRVWLSMERNMQCAVGFCGHCQLGPQFICKDGPVLRLDHVAPYLEVEQL